MTSTPAGTVRVAREGGRGWHFIAQAKYDASPDDFSLVGDDGKPIEDNQPTRTPAEVLAMAEDASVKFPTFRKAAKALLGDALADGAKKPEIIEALKALD